MGSCIGALDFLSCHESGCDSWPSILKSRPLLCRASCRLTAQCERMAALKSNDVEAYMRLVQGVRNSKLDKLLAEVCLGGVL